MQNIKKEDLLRELIHKSWHRGCKETDILLGYFSREILHNMNDEFLTLYKEFISEADWDIYAWLTNESNTPEKYKEMVSEIIKYHEKLHQ